jgi:isochorismate hydrolase
VARLLIPEKHDYFVLKPKHSAFYSTSLDTLLSYLGHGSSLSRGSQQIFVFYSPQNDAHMRDFELLVPVDCIASETSAARRAAAQQMKRFLGADVRPSRGIRIANR